MSTEDLARALDNPDNIDKLKECIDLIDRQLELGGKKDKLLHELRKALSAQITKVHQEKRQEKKERSKEWSDNLLKMKYLDDKKLLVQEQIKKLEEKIGLLREQHKTYCNQIDEIMEKM